MFQTVGQDGILQRVANPPRLCNKTVEQRLATAAPDTIRPHKD